MLSKTFESGRTAAWARWAEFRQQYGPVATRWMAETFELPAWGRAGEKLGIGGPKWGTCARLVYDYEVGDITAQTFIDRAWTMEHNGGNIFNKLYVTCGNDLMRVLETQHTRPYDELARQSSVEGLWREDARYNRREVTT